MGILFSFLQVEGEVGKQIRPTKIWTHFDNQQRSDCTPKVATEDGKIHPSGRRTLCTWREKAYGGHPHIDSFHVKHLLVKPIRSVYIFQTSEWS